MTTSTASPATRSHWSGHADDAELEHWSAVAESVAALLAVDVLERDRANQDPHTELDVLRSHGLVNLLDPRAVGGGGGHWETALHVVRILARVDASVAQVLAYHYVNSANIAFAADPAEQRGWYERTVAGRWVWGDAVNPVDPDLVLTAEGAGFRLDGLKRFSTGASVGDIVLAAGLVRGGERDGQSLLVALDHDRSGISYLGDWDHLGQRLSASGSVRFEGVRVEAADVLGALSDEPFPSLVTPAIQLAFGNLYLGIAQGVLTRGIDLVRERRNSWFLSQADRYRDDPFVQRTVGELASRITAVEALADRVNRRFDAVVGLGDALTAAGRGDLAIEIARLKVVSSDVGVDATSRIFEVTGSSSTRSAVGLDLFWRNIRTHSLHDPVDFKKLEVGAWELNGELQPISLYT